MPDKPIDNYVTPFIDVDEGQNGRPMTFRLGVENDDWQVFQIVNHKDREAVVVVAKNRKKAKARSSLWVEAGGRSWLVLIDKLKLNEAEQEQVFLVIQKWRGRRGI